MSLSLGENLSPLPVSTRMRRAPAPLPTSTSRHRVVYSQRLLASHETSFDHSVFGTTPCMAPPSRRKLPPLSMVSRASPSASMPPSCHGAAGAAGPGSGAATPTGGAVASGATVVGGAATGAAGAGSGAVAGSTGTGVAGSAGTGTVAGRLLPDAFAAATDATTGPFGLWTRSQSATRATSPKRVSLPSFDRNDMK